MTKSNTSPAPVSIRNRYIRDKNDSNRVLTIVTRLTQGSGTAKNKIEYGISVNSPPRLVRLEGYQLDELDLCPVHNSDLVVYRKLPGDKFSRVRGRTIALGQLNCERTVRSFDIDLDTENPYEKVLQDIVTLKGSNPQAARIARDALVDFKIREAATKVMVANESDEPVSSSSEHNIKFPRRVAPRPVTQLMVSPVAETPKHV